MSFQLYIYIYIYIYFVYIYDIYNIYIYIYIHIHGILSLEDEGGEGIFQGQYGDSFIWRICGESQLGTSLCGLQYQFLAQLANAGQSL